MPLSVPAQGLTPAPLVEAHRGALRVNFPPQRIWSLLELERYQLQVEGSGEGPLRHRLAQLVDVRASVSLSRIRHELNRRRLRGGLVEELEVSFEEGVVSLLGLLRSRRGILVPFSLRGALHPIGGGFRFELYRGACFGDARLPIPRVAAQVLRELELPVNTQHPTTLHIHFLTELSLSLCLPWGWKLPLRELPLRTHADARRLYFSATAEHPSGTPDLAEDYLAHLDALRLFHEAERLLHQGDYRAALDILEASPDSPFALGRRLELSLCYHDEREDPSLLARQALENCPGPGALAQAVLQSRRGESQEAAAWLSYWAEELGASDGERAQALFGQALLLQRSDPSGARAALETAVAIRPGSPQLYHALSRFALEEGALPEAAQWMRRRGSSLEEQGLTQEAAWSFSQLGELYRASRDPSAAEDAFHQALSLSNAHIPAYQGLATLAEEAGQAQLAVRYLDQALQRLPRRGGHRGLAEEMEARLLRLSRPAAPIAPSADEPSLEPEAQREIYHEELPPSESQSSLEDQRRAGSGEAYSTPLVGDAFDEVTPLREPLKRDDFLDISYPNEAPKEHLGELTTGMSERGEEISHPAEEAEGEYPLDIQSQRRATALLAQAGMSPPPQAPLPQTVWTPGEDVLNTLDVSLEDFAALHSEEGLDFYAPYHDEESLSWEREENGEGIDESDSEREERRESPPSKLDTGGAAERSRSRLRLEITNDSLLLPPSQNGVEEGDGEVVDPLSVISSEVRSLLRAPAREQPHVSGLRARREATLEERALHQRDETQHAEPSLEELVSNPLSLSEDLSPLAMNESRAEGESSRPRLPRQRIKLGGGETGFELNEGWWSEESFGPQRFSPEQRDSLHWDDDDETLRELERALEAASPEERPAKLLAIADFYRDERLDLSSAISQLWRICEEVPPVHPVWQDAVEGLSDLHTIQQDWASLAHLYERRIDAITDEMSQRSLHLQRASVLRTMGRLEDAVEAARSALPLEDALHFLAGLLAALGEVEIAVRTLTDDIEECSPEEALERQRLAAELLTDRSPAQAAQLYEAIYSASDEEPDLDEWVRHARRWGDPLGLAAVTRAQVRRHREENPRSRARRLSQLAKDLQLRAPRLSLDLVTFHH